MTKKKEFYTVQDVSKALRVSISTVHGYIKKGMLNASQVHGSGPYRIKPDEFKRFINAGS